MKSKSVHILVTLALFCVFLMAYPSVKNSLNDTVISTYEKPEIMDPFISSSESEKDTQHVKDDNSSQTPSEHTSLTGLRTKDLYELKLYDSEAFFRESYRKNVLKKGEKTPVYYTKEARKRAAQHKLSERLIAHLNRENS